jgi:O-Antigen ligase
MFNPRQKPVPQPEAVGLSRDSDSESISPMEQKAWLLFIAVHAPLALWMRAESLIVFAQGTMTFALGIWWALNPRRPERVAYVGAYVVGSEVLWRMLTDALPWESGKYGLVALFGATLLNRDGLKGMVVPALCFGLLVPSAFLTIRDFDPMLARGMLSFNLSGPLALAICAQFFSRLELSPARTLRLFLALVAPVVGIGALVLSNIVTAEHIQFTFESNFATSGGFGPNQVSLALGLGALASLWCVLERGIGWLMRVVLFGIMVWLLTQSALTFSRGGLLGALISGSVALIFLLKNPETRKKLIVVVPLLVALGYYVIWPSLVQFTGGNLEARYEDTGLTHRDELGKEDLDLWAESPLLGVGPGQSPFHHLNGVAAHTEFTRLLAEHGLFGAFFIVLLLGRGIRNVIRGESAREKGLVASAFSWSMLFMVNSAMRTVAPSFMYGLSFNIFRPASARSNDEGESLDRSPGPVSRRRYFGARREPSAAA